MINVDVYQNNQEIQKLEISGHAYSGEPGFDLICAGVSSIAVGALNGLHELTKDCDLELTDEPRITITCERENSDNQLLLKFVLIQLETIEEEYAEYIKINVKEAIR